MVFNVVAALALIAATGTGTTLHDSSVTFQRALAACPGALGSVSFALGHARVAASPGVDTDESAPDPDGTLVVVLENVNGTKSAQVSIDQKRRSVSAKNLHTQMNRRVACVFPD